MAHRTRSWCGRMTRASSLLMIAALIALPAAASDTPTKASTPTLKASMQHIVARDVAAKPAVTAVVRADRQTSPAGSSPGFFKSGPGMVAIAVTKGTALVISLVTGFLVFLFVRTRGGDDPLDRR